jgi:hypothetical protein
MSNVVDCVFPPEEYNTNVNWSDPMNERISRNALIAVLEAQDPSWRRIVQF